LLKERLGIINTITLHCPRGGGVAGGFGKKEKERGDSEGSEVGRTKRNSGGLLKLGKTSRGKRMGGRGGRKESEVDSSTRKERF